MKILSASDIHLGTFTPYNKSTDTYGIGTRLQERIDALLAFFDYGSKNNIKHYVLNGDLFDKRLKEDINIINYIIHNVVKGFSYTPEGSTLYLNVGNHDEQSRYLSPNSCELFRNIKIKNHTIKIIDDLAVKYTLDDNTTLLFIPYTEDVRNSKSAILHQATQLNTPTTVFAHLGVNNSVTGRYSRTLDGAYNLTDLLFDNDNVLNIVLGHYHKRQFLQGEDNSSIKSAWYQGNLLPMDFNDVESNGMGSPRGFDMIDTETGEHTFINLCGAPYNFKTFNIIDLDTANISLKELETLSATNYVKVLTSTLHKEDLHTNQDTLKNASIVIKPSLETPKVTMEIKSNNMLDILQEYCKQCNVEKEVELKATQILKNVLGGDIN